MDCATFEDIVHDLDRKGTPGAAQCESALAHAESCHTCAALLTQVEWLEFSLLKLAEAAATRQASPRIEAAALREFRHAKDVAAHRQIRWRLAALAAAAALFLALGLTLRHRELPSTLHAPDTAVQTAHETPQLGSAPPADSERPRKPAANPTIAQRHSASREPNDATDSGETADAATFVRLPYADDSAALDGGAIVRVELPRAALASFGLPVAEYGDAQRILADLIVSADGTPEAIRLVSESNTSQEF
jgi:hypothetical protein